MSESGPGGEKPLRLTKDVRQALLDTNEGFTDSSYYSSKNFTEARLYEIADGRLHVRSNSKTSWADSRQVDRYVADEEATHRFLSKNLHHLDTEGVREKAAAARAARKAAEKAERETLARQAQTIDAPGEDLVSVSRVIPATKRVQPSGTSLDRAITVATALGAAILAAPHVKKAWQTKVGPKVRAWRTRRATANAQPVQQPDEGSECCSD